MDYNLLISMLIGIGIVLLPVSLFAYYGRIPYQKRGSWIRKELVISSKEQIYDKLMILVSKRKIINFKQIDNLLIFKDLPSILNWGNMYVIDVNPKGKEAYIYCRRNLPVGGGYYIGPANRLFKRIAGQVKNRL
ncbi:MAG: hypothetical protein JXR56_08870 [Candidatus Cloacimonetes bacterium]|nr:hypothetical protein [Candidatus Cloacimonadota bacterium]